MDSQWSWWAWSPMLRLLVDHSHDCSAVCRGKAWTMLNLCLIALRGLKAEENICRDRDRINTNNNQTHDKWENKIQSRQEKHIKKRRDKLTSLTVGLAKKQGQNSSELLLTWSHPSSVYLRTWSFRVGQSEWKGWKHVTLASRFRCQVSSLLFYPRSLLSLGQGEKKKRKRGGNTTQLTTCQGWGHNKTAPKRAFHACVIYLFSYSLNEADKCDAKQ